MAFIQAIADATSSGTRFSLENMSFLCDVITQLNADTQDPGPLIDALRELVEVAVWGDKHDEAIFDHFLERSVVEFFSDAINDARCHVSVKVQCLQCVTILLQNLSRQQSTYFLLSNNHVNRVISASLDFEDDEMVSHYISFVKALSLRLNNETVQFFFDRDRGAFPLFTAAIGLTGHTDRLVRTSVRQTAVNVLQITEEHVAAFMATAGPDFFGRLAAFVEVLVATAASSVVGSATRGLVDAQVEDIVDDLFFLNDLADVADAAGLREALDATVEGLVERLADAAAVPTTGDADMDARRLVSLSALAHWCRLLTVPRWAAALPNRVLPVVAAVLQDDARWAEHPVAAGLVAAALQARPPPFREALRSHATALVPALTAAAACAATSLHLGTPAVVAVVAEVLERVAEVAAESSGTALFQDATKGLAAIATALQARTVADECAAILRPVSLHNPAPAPTEPSEGERRSAESDRQPKEDVAEVEGVESKRAAGKEERGRDNQHEIAQAGDEEREQRGPQNHDGGQESGQEGGQEGGQENDGGEQKAADVAADPGGEVESAGPAEPSVEQADEHGDDEPAAARASDMSDSDAEAEPEPEEPEPTVGPNDRGDITAEETPDGEAADGEAAEGEAVHSEGPHPDTEEPSSSHDEEAHRLAERQFAARVLDIAADCVQHGDPLRSIRTATDRVGRDVSYLRWPASRGAAADLPLKLHTILLLRRRVALMAERLAAAGDGLGPRAATLALWAVDTPLMDLVRPFLAGAPDPQSEFPCELCELGDGESVDVLKCLPFGLPLVAGVAENFLTLRRHRRPSVAHVPSWVVAPPPPDDVVVPLVFACAVLDNESPFRLRLQLHSTATQKVSPVRDVVLCFRTKAACAAATAALGEAAITARDTACSGLLELLQTTVG